LNERSLELIEYFRVTAAVAERAASVRGRAALESWGPIAAAAERGLESERLAQAIQRAAEPGSWCAVGPGDLGATLDQLARGGPEGSLLREALDWIEAGAATASAWTDAARRERHPRLAALVPEEEPLEALRRRLAEALDERGQVRDGASPKLKRLRAEAAGCERRLAEQLERWARGFGADAYVTRHGERFVAMVPAAGFPRRRAIVHDVSGSGQSLLVEPLEWCGENNHMIESRRAALDEERRILAELGRQVEEARPAIAAMEAALVHLDTLRARARWALEVGAHALAPEGDALRLDGARHPLLAMGVGRASDQVVPLDLALHSGAVSGKVLLVSGPNMGGKTVLLKTVGLAVTLAHAAFPVTAGEGSRVPELDELLVDIGDDQSIERGLSTFAAHLQAWSAMAAAAGPRTLVLVDEVAAGTDPEDGAALARALIEHLASAGAWAVVTTHLGSLKRLAGEVAGVENGSLEFDVATLSPRFRFLPGVPGASHALEVAERLGVPGAVLARARALRSREAAAMDQILADLAQVTRRAREEAERLAAASAEAEAQAARHREAVEHARAEEAALRRRLTRESEALLARARAVWQTLQREARRADKHRAEIEPARREMADVEREVEVLAGPATQRNGAGGPRLDPAELRPGVRVRVLDLGVEAIVVSGPDREGRVQLQRGSWNIQSHLQKLAPAAPAGAPAPGPPSVTATWSTPEGAPIEVDLRGKDVGDALVELDRGVDRAVLAGLGEVRVIHGIGRGVLRIAVERHLKEHPQVTGVRAGEVGEGGRGVTVARLK
jgi:DNA mismatch repair protein MutS2